MYFSINKSISLHHLAMGKTEGDREGPFPSGPINLISWVGPGGTIYNENGPFLLLLDCFSAIAKVV